MDYFSRLYIGDEYNKSFFFRKLFFFSATHILHNFYVHGDNFRANTARTKSTRSGTAHWNMVTSDNIIDFMDLNTNSTLAYTRTVCLFTLGKSCNPVLKSHLPFYAKHIIEYFVMS